MKMTKEEMKQANNPHVIVFYPVNIYELERPYPLNVIDLDYSSLVQNQQPKSTSSSSPSTVQSQQPQSTSSSPSTV